MKNAYSIGEVSQLLGISSQTLRYYDKIGIAHPAFVDAKTGYRRYSYDQIHYIDRIRYLQDFGLSLTEIRSALQSEDINEMMSLLSKRRTLLENEISELQNKKENLEWYMDYYQYLDKNPFPQIPFKRTIAKRYLLASPFQPGESIYGTAGYRLTKEQSRPEFKNQDFLRQNGYLLDFQGLLRSKIVPLSYFIYLKEKPTIHHPMIQEIPSGEFLCFRGKILSDEWNPEYIIKFFENENKRNPRIVIADEYEDNFYEFQNCIYEIQILLSSFQENN